jgi:adenylate cyclase
LAFLIPCLAALVGLSVQLLDPLPLVSLRNAMFDQYQRWHPRIDPAMPVRIVDIDEESLKRIGQWPWPRTRVAELTQRIRAAGATAIGFDFIFAEPDRSSASAVAAQWLLSPAVRDALLALPDNDRVLADSLRGGDVVLGTALERGGEAGAPPPRTAQFATLGSLDGSPLHEFQRAVRPLAILESAAAGIGALNFIPDADGVIRRVPLVLGLGGQPQPTLDAEMLRVAQHTAEIRLRAAEGGGGLAAISIGAHEIPVTRRGEMWLHFTPRTPERTLPAWKVLAGDFPRAALDGHLVLVGTSAQGLFDLRFSPLGEIVPGVEIHAQALDQVLAGEYLVRPHWAAALEAIVLLVGGIAIGIFAVRGGAMLSALATLLLLVLLLGGAWHAFAKHGLLLDPLTPGLMLLASFVLGSSIHHREAERRQRWVREAFSRYVSPNLVTHLIDHPDLLELGGERRECSFVFTDLANFTHLLEGADPARAVSLLNRYLDGMIAIAFRHEGTLDRVVGDAIAIMFSAPLTQPDHRRRALACALEMRDFAVRHRAELAAEGMDFGLTRIGVNCGEVIVGNLGGNAIFDYRALGDPVNTASRLETANKWLGTQVCVSQAVLDGCPQAVARPIGHLRLEGKATPVMTWEALAVSADAGMASDPAYAAAFRLLDVAPAAAAQAFAELRAQRPDDPLVRLHAERTARGESGDLIRLGGK